jgi:hypothetical protein
LDELINRHARIAAPRAWLANWYILRVTRGWSEDRKREAAEALSATHAALDRDPSDALALATEGFVYCHLLKDLDTARKRCEQAVDANPSHALGWLYRGVVNAFKGEGSAAVDATRRAMELSPLDPQRYYFESLGATDGCPFAAAQFLENTAGGLRTRVRAIWDQNTGRQPINVKDKNGQACVLGQTLSDLTYGLEFRRVSHLPGPPGRLMGLNEWIDLHVAPQGGIDEDGCYAGAGFPGLAHEASHGAHVMDVVAGRLPPSSRTGPPSDRRDPPSWKANTDPASATDVVFVQFSEACIRDATGVWLKSYVYDAILYILSNADQHNTDHVVINLSYGPTTGPHDGLADLEPLLTTFVKKYDGIARKPKLDIVLAAGNSYLSEGHVRFHRHRDQPDSIEWTWRLPPDNTTLCFAEIWVKRAYAGVIDVTLVSPSGVRYRPTAPVTPPPNPLPPAGVDLPIQWSIDDTMWQLHVDPTVATAGVVAEHGDWTIQLANVPEHVTVHAYVARTDPNMNVHSGARRSFFVDAEWERSRAAEASCKYVDGMFDKHGSLIRRHGTLNGIATAKDDAVHVAGGYILSNERKSSYSSAGRARPGPLRRRIGPDYLLPCDDSYALSGVLAGGNRSGSVFRLIGTSTAAPQLARHIVNAAAGWPFPVPHVPVYPPDEERGLGNLDPP